MIRRTFVVAVLSAAALMLAAFPLLAADDLRGTWEGLIEVDPGKVEVDFQLAVTSPKEGKIWFPTQGATRHPLMEIEQEDDAVKFVTVDAQGVISSFEGTVSGDTIRGDLTEQGMTRPFVLRRISTEPTTDALDLPELTVLGATGEGLVEAFNRDSDKIRMIAVLSPTCGVCRMGARMVERYLFERAEDPLIQVYVVWEPALPDDDEAAARDATFFLDSERATHFWSAERYVGSAYRQPLELEEPAWDVFLVFPPGVEWTGTTPEVQFYMHNLRGRLPDETLFDATELARRIDAMLSREIASR